MVLFTETACTPPFERVLRRDRAIVGVALAIITILAWLYVLRLAADMDMRGMDMTGTRMVSSGFTMVMAPALKPWSGAETISMFLMWAVMMIGMMLPSATPMILLYARVGRSAATEGKPFAATGWFATGYLLAWLGFALAATAAQWALERAALLTPMMESASKVLGGIVFITAGLYQWSSLKDTCLAQCQAPLLFIQRYGGFRRDVSGALEIGFRHGTYCVGCCWALMTLLFVVGVMNVLWIAAIATFVLAEKIVAGGRLVPRVTGVILIVGGACLFMR